MRNETNRHRLARVVISALDRECREWTVDRTEFAIQRLVQAHDQPYDPAIFTDGSVL